jgi:hypothetical protein
MGSMPFCLIAPAACGPLMKAMNLRAASADVELALAAAANVV